MRKLFALSLFFMVWLFTANAVQAQTPAPTPTPSPRPCPGRVGLPHHGHVGARFGGFYGGYGRAFALAPTYGFQSSLAYQLALADAQRRALAEEQLRQLALGEAPVAPADCPGATVGAGLYGAGAYGGGTVIVGQPLHLFGVRRGVHVGFQTALVRGVLNRAAFLRAQRQRALVLRAGVVRRLGGVRRGAVVRAASVLRGVARIVGVARGVRRIR